MQPVRKVLSATHFREVSPHRTSCSSLGYRAELIWCPRRPGRRPLPGRPQQDDPETDPLFTWRTGRDRACLDGRGFRRTARAQVEPGGFQKGDRGQQEDGDRGGREETYRVYDREWWRGVVGDRNREMWFWCTRKVIRLYIPLDSMVFLVCFCYRIRVSLRSPVVSIFWEYLLSLSMSGVLLSGGDDPQVPTSACHKSQFRLP
jgi:hypothetical protein